MIDIKLEIVNNDTLKLSYDTRYAGGGIYNIQSPQQLVDEIQKLLGKGSFVIRSRNRLDVHGKPSAIFFAEREGLTKEQIAAHTIPYFIQAIKTQVIEQTREVARKVWGDIPEMQCPWMEEQCTTYIEDILTT